jgi:glutamate synthase domain-containing protein 3
VFALHDGDVQVGLICSEKQAVDATLESLAHEDPRFGTVADRYWNARGGSHTDGGAFIFNLDEHAEGAHRRILTCIDKFGREIRAPENQIPYNPNRVYPRVGSEKSHSFGLSSLFELQRSDLVYEYVREVIKDWHYGDLIDCLKAIGAWASNGSGHFEVALAALTSLLDRRYPTFDKKRRSILQLVNETVRGLLRNLPFLIEDGVSSYRLVDWKTRQLLRPPLGHERGLVIDATHFPPEGETCDSRLLADAFFMGWRRFVVFGLKGQRFHGSGLGPNSHGVHIDLYGSSGDYLGSGIDGLTMAVHGNAQDQVGQIMKSGKIIIYGDTGQTFLYGAKGGEVYVMGNAAGRPLINAVGKPRVVINGTCLDYLAESFMAGDPLNGGGFVVLNGVEFNDHGQVQPQPTPYPGSNLFSLASGGAIYIRDPFAQVDHEQLNGGEIVTLEDKDWELILPYLKENERLFGISVERDLLSVNGSRMNPLRVYRKVRPSQRRIEQSGLEEWEGLEQALGEQYADAA